MKYALIFMVFVAVSCSKTTNSSPATSTSTTTGGSTSAKISFNTLEYGDHVYDVISVPFVLQVGYLDGEMKSSVLKDTTSIRIHFSFQGSFDTVPIPFTYDEKSIVQYGYGSIECFSSSHTIFTWGTGKGDNAMSIEILKKSGTTLNGYISTGLTGKKYISGSFKFTYTNK